LLGVLLTEHVGVLARHGLALSAGVTLYVAASNLVPEFQAKRGWLTAVAFFGGAVGYFLTEHLLARLMQ
jgi:ZIP family zinc transporter/zinc and cadmium transporter